MATCREGQKPLGLLDEGAPHNIGKLDYTGDDKEDSMMAKMWSILSLIAAASAVFGGGCGDGSTNTSGVVSCTTSTSMGSLEVKFCQEAPASLGPQIQQGCTLSSGQVGDAGVSFGAHFTNGPCSHVDAIGGCKITNGHPRVRGRCRLALGR